MIDRIDGKDFRILVVVRKAKDICDAQKLAIVKMALDLDTHTHGVYPMDFWPNVELDAAWSFARRTASRCGLRYVWTTLVDFIEVRLAESSEQTQQSGVPSEGCLKASAEVPQALVGKWLGATATGVLIVSILSFTSMPY